jgi:LysR family transcriptional regulator, hydrogen peroxide-inducible genes activator
MAINLNLRDLEYLVALDEERSFRRAAERCFVSQPTLSGQLKKLEERLGVQLIERTTRQVVMTDVGRAVVEQARQVLGEAREVTHIAATYHDPMAGELQLGLIPTVAPYLLPLIMPALKKDFPDLKLWLHEQQTAVLLERLRRAELDLLILALPVAGSEEFVGEDLFSEPFWLALPKGDPLSRNKAVRLSDIDKRDLMLLEEGHCLREHALDVCLSAGAGEYDGFHATSLETLRHMVGEGMGITLMPQLSVPQRRKKTDAVQYLPFTAPPPSRRIGMLWRRGSYREAAFRAVAERVRAVVAIN